MTKNHYTPDHLLHRARVRVHIEHRIIVIDICQYDPGAQQWVWPCTVCVVVYMMLQTYKCVRTTYIHVHTRTYMYICVHTRVWYMCVVCGVLACALHCVLDIMYMCTTWCTTCTYHVHMHVSCTHACTMYTCMYHVHMHVSCTHACIMYTCTALCWFT